MEVMNYNESEGVVIDKFPYKGKMHDVTGTTIRWLSKFGDDAHGYPEYGLRHFTIRPGGKIPIHNHFYHQTMYILSGRIECCQFNPDTDAVVKKTTAKPGDSIYVPSMEPHGMKNNGDDPGTFLCCICNIYNDEEPIQE